MRVKPPAIVLRLIAGLASLALFVCANAADIRSMQIATNTDSTRATFEISGPLDYKLFQTANPNRIVLDIRSSNWEDGFEVPTAKGLLKSIRTGKQGKSDIRVVFDLTG